ncbi:MAG: competence protein ComEC [Nitrospinaceae bacterium]|nr:competence protein ComEC [Nitrospinaceae bacterium]NIR55846.1 competence protein ComEC [Nitrospinaceae bacterium]NIS86299.1 competence protein ComEC [Nitrospinaceae bacterium]NIT83128.1 competence protein ComEC [Nitrospinaceae bacterium]NIU45338.1 competence protein ComEC [Nitrospinaceae bacterium]
MLKGPHHGSRYSNSPPFIRAVSPRAVIFSSGYLNPMHHPHPQVIDRYQNAGIRIWRTDRDGAIRITSDGFHHKIKSYGIR